MVATPIDAYAPFDGGAGASVTEGTWRNMMRNAGSRGSGVLRGSLSEFNVFADSTGLNVKVSMGECWVEGHWGQNSATKVLPITSPHATLPRYDLVVVRLDAAANVIALDVVPGTPAVAPTIPTPSQSSSLAYEIPLAWVVVVNGATSIAAGDVNDYRQFTQPHVRYYMSSSQTVATATDNVEVQFSLPGRVGYDVQPAAGGAGHVRWAFKRAGLWTVETNVKWGIGTTGSRRLYIGAGGALATAKYAEQRTSAAPDEVGMNLAHTRYFAVNDQVSVGVQHTQGAALGLVGGADGLTWISFTWMGY